LVGEELLMLQGIPVDDLLLTKETEENLKDLAGNAMSTTVVGACMLAALLVGQNALSLSGKVSPSIQAIACLVPRPLEPLSDVCISRKFGDYEEYTEGSSTTCSQRIRKWSSFLQDASTAAKLCVSESEDEAIPWKDIAQCSVCGHTSSIHNAYPSRKYEEHDFRTRTTDSTRLEPSVFRRHLIELIPMRVNITGIDVNALQQPANIESVLWNAWKGSIRSSLVLENGRPVEFRFAGIVRAQAWTALYESPCQARLEIRILKQSITWFLFADPQTNECETRTIFKRPFARMSVSPAADGTFSMLIGQWKICLPIQRNFQVSVTGMGKLVPSWRNRLGLKGGFEKETEYETIRLCTETSDPQISVDFKSKIDGDYILLPKCGGACGSLRKRISDVGNDEDAMYFYLSSSRSTLSCDDSYVISKSFHRTDYNEYREIYLELDKDYSPMYFDSNPTNNQIIVPCSSNGCWLPIENATVSEVNCHTVARYPLRSLSVPMQIDGWKECPELLSATIQVDASDDVVTKCLRLGGCTELNLEKSKKVLKDIAFATSRWKLPDIFSSGDWITLCVQDGRNDDQALLSERCAPIKPKIIWTSVSKGKKSSFIPIEDSKQAGIYERALKSRPKPWILRFSVASRSDEAASTLSMTIQIGCNVVSLVQRALGLLPETSINQRSSSKIRSVATTKFEWRVAQHSDLGVNFPKLLFSSNKMDVEAAQPPGFKKYGLRKEQLRSLTWMLNQESTTEPFYEEEVSEAVLPSLNWRIEGRVRRPVFLRGGIIADEVGYGKTAITLGLIDSAPSMASPDCSSSRYIYAKATLIVVPKHLMGQWPDEVRKFLGTSKKVCVIKDLTSLNKLTIGDIHSADIVIVSFAVLNNETYFARLARLSGINPASFVKGNGSSRHFAAVYGECIEALYAQVENIVTNTSKVYGGIKNTAEAYENEKQCNSVLLDSKKSVYKNKKNEPKVTCSSSKCSGAENDPWGLSNVGVHNNYMKMSCPPLELFFWQRLVVDE
jgi:SNF2-related domain